MRRLLLLLCLVAATGTVTAQESRFIVVQAEGWVEAVPDTLVLPVTVKQTGSELAKVRARADKLTAQIIKLARDAGIEADDIDSSRLSVRPEYEWRNNNRRYLGETVEREIRLTLRDLDAYSGLVQQLTSLDLHGIRPPQLSHSKIESLQLQALEVALTRGKRKAETIAARIDAQLGPVLQVQERGTGHSQPQPRMMAEAMTADAGSAPGLSVARQRINAQLEIRYQLQ
ncbi:MAG: SIMPL domain-containing protein [Halieaceae bacterium]